MPEISRFYGVFIRMFFDDHNPPHIHAEYGEDEALININTLGIIAGRLPSRALAWLSNGQQKRDQKRVEKSEKPRTAWKNPSTEINPETKIFVQIYQLLS